MDVASIQRYKKGWMFRVSYKENGKYKTKTKTGFRTKKEAEIAAAELEKKLKGGYDLSASEQFFPDYMRNWFEIYKKGKYSISHERNIELSVRLVEKHFANVRMKDITRDMYQKFINELGKKYSTATVRKRHTYIKECLKMAQEDQIITRDPTYKVIIKGNDEDKVEEELKYLNYEEVKKLIAEIKKHLRPDYISRYIILFAIATGARFAEIIGLTWDCVDFQNKTVTFNKTWDYKFNNDFSSTKTYDSKRTITIDDDTLNLLKELKNNQNKMRLKSGLGEKYNPKNLVFINYKMEVVTNKAVNKVLRKLCKRLNITPITTHGLRHTHASILLYKGVNIKYISRRLGHKDIVTTLQTYSHIMDEMEQKESRVVDEMMKDLFA